jgi:hypothetical protein
LSNWYQAAEFAREIFPVRLSAWVYQSRLANFHQGFLPEQCSRDIDVAQARKLKLAATRGPAHAPSEFIGLGSSDVL